MSKFKQQALMSASAFMCAFTFTACSSSDDVADAPINPTFDGNKVKTTFAISITDAAGNKTRMSDEETQSDGSTFNGMTDIMLFPFALVKTGQTIDGEKVDGTTTITEPISLDDIASSNGWTGENDNKKVYSDISLGLGVSNFLFYGQSALKKENRQGALTASFNETGTSNTVAEKIKFQLENAYSESVTEGGNTKNAVDDEAALLAVLNNVYKAFPKDDKIPQELLPVKEAFKMLKAGSATTIMRTMENIYNAVKDAAAGSAGEDVRKAIVGESNNGPFKYDETSSSFGWADPPTVTVNSASKTINTHYPSTYGLPDGAVVLKFEKVTDASAEADGKFSYDNVGTIGDSHAVARSRYKRPAALWYFANSQAMTSDNEHFGDGTSGDALNLGWDKQAANTTGTVVDKYKSNVVSASTKSVIIKDRVQYGVGLLEASVKMGDGVIKDSKDQTVTTPTDGYPFTGILIGGQKNVGWDFTPLSGDDYFTIWDYNVTITEEQPSNHTLVLESEAGESGKAGKAVYVAVEFKNTGSEFYGKDGQIIPAGGTFYLTAKLDPASTKDGEVTKPNDASDLNQVFKQDYVTKANFTINSLKNATNVIPDLRTPQLEFGLSVDLTWKSGLTFDVTIE